MSDITIYIDGSCEPQNPGGYACWAYVATRNGKEIARNYGCVGHGEGMTNNVAEYHALQNALKRALKEGWVGCVIKSDSKLVVNQVNGAWACRQMHLFDLMKDCAQRLDELQATLTWIPREENERADHLSNVAYHKALQDAI